MTRLDDPDLVAREYADEERLRRRAAMYTGERTGVDAREPAVRALVDLAPRRVLEVGCGWGALAEWVREATGAEVVATDLSPRMVELARERGLDARVADAQSLPFDDGEFDAVVAAWMLYHVPDRARAIAELARVLRPGGALVAITNSAFHLQEMRDLVGSGPSPSTFTSENGAEQLLAAFDSVDRIDVDGVHEFPDRAAVEEYVRASISMSPFVDNLPLAIDEPFRTRRGNSVFVAKKGGVTHLNDPAVVRKQYETERGLAARQAIWREYSGDDPKATLWDAIAAARPRRVLEVGGGQGELSHRIAEELGAEVTMIDQSERMVELAQGLGVGAQVGDVQELPFHDGSFDTVVAAWMLYHVTDIDRGLAEIVRVLEPGGTFIANTSSRDHNVELFDLIGYPAETRDLSFNAENGEEILRRHFARVERRDTFGRATIRERRLLVEYRDSLSGVPSSPVPDDVELPFVTSSRGALFVATP